MKTLIKKHQKLLAIIIGFALITGFYAWNFPPFEGPDEPEHFAYISWLAEGKGFPPQGDAAWETPIRQEAGQSPLYYFLASLLARVAGAPESPAIYRANPHFVGPLPRTIPDNDNRAIHHPEDAQRLEGGWLAIYLARGLSLLFGIVLLIGVYGLGREVAPANRHIATLATLFVAVTPQILFISGMASNDIAAAALSAVTLWQLAGVIRHGLSYPRSILVGVAFGLAILFKASTIALALPVGGALLYLWLGQQNKFRDVFIHGIVMVAATLLVAGWWLLRNWLLFGSPLGLGTHDQTPWAITDPSRLAIFHRRWMEVFRSYWLAFGWGTIRPGDTIYFIMLGLVLIALIGLGIGIRRRWQEDRRLLSKDIALVVILLLAILGVALGLEAWMRRVIATHGRLMFPAAAAIAVLLVIGWHTLHPKLPYIMIGLLLGLAIVSPSWLISPAYAAPKLISSEAANELTPAVGWQFGPTADQPIAELLTLSPKETSVVAGNNLPLEVCWRVIAQSEQPYSILIQLIGPENGVAAARRTYPGLGKYATTIWEPGAVFCDLVNVTIPKTLDETLVYLVEIALLDQENGERLPAYDNQGNLLTATFLNKIRLVSLEGPETFETTDLQGERDIQLIDYARPDVWQVGSQQDLILRWGSMEPIEGDYQVFVHLRDRDSGENMAQADGPPLGGWYPTSWWPPNIIIKEERTFPVPADIKPGRYDLFAGFYDLESGERFGAENYLGEIEVRP